MRHRGYVADVPQTLRVRGPARRRQAAALRPTAIVLLRANLTKADRSDEPVVGGERKIIYAATVEAIGATRIEHLRVEHSVGPCPEIFVAADGVEAVQGAFAYRSIHQPLGYASLHLEDRWHRPPEGDSGDEEEDKDEVGCAASESGVPVGLLQGSQDAAQRQDVVPLVEVLLLVREVYDLAILILISLHVAMRRA